MTNQIKITGLGELSLRPDLTVIHFTVKALKDSYKESADFGGAMLEHITNQLEKLGISSEELKTESFSIRAKYGYEGVDHKKYVFKGYYYEQRMILEIDRDNQLLNQILGILNALLRAPDIDISFSIKDKEKANNLLLEKAVKNAKEKARVIARASEVELGNIVNIDYSYNKVLFDVNPCGYDSLCSARRGEMDEEVSIDINPEDIVISDTVTITFEIK